MIFCYAINKFYVYFKILVSVFLYLFFSSFTEYRYPEFSIQATILKS